MKETSKDSTLYFFKFLSKNFSPKFELLIQGAAYLRLFTVFYSDTLHALVSGKPRTPVPGECGAIVGDFSGF